MLATGKTGLPPNADGHLELGELDGDGAADRAGAAGGVPDRAAAHRRRRPDRRPRPGADDGRAVPAGRRDPRRGVRDRGRRAAGRHRPSRGWRSSRWASAAATSSTTCPTWTSSSWPPATRTCRAGTTVAARLIEICGQVAWPVDAALRPEGSRGPLVRTLASHQAYYRRWARTWEFQALLKARPAAGDLALGAASGSTTWRRWCGTPPSGPRRSTTSATCAARSSTTCRRTSWTGRSSAGRAGCATSSSRCSCCSSCTAGSTSRCAQPGTLPALRALVAGGYVGRDDGETLLRGYRFLRGVEHRLQLQHLRRTHTVPDDPAALRWLAARAGLHGALPGRDAVEAFRVRLGRPRRAGAPPARQAALPAAAGGGGPGAGRGAADDAGVGRAGGCEILGFADPAGALRHLEALTGGVTRTAAIQRTLLPVLLQEFADAPEPDRGLLNYRQVSDKLGTHAVVPAAAARRRPGGAPARPRARPVPVRGRPAHPRPGGAAAARRRRRAGSRGSARGR